MRKARMTLTILVLGHKEMLSFRERAHNDVNSLNMNMTNTLGVTSGILSTQLSGPANLCLASLTAVCPEACCTLISWPHS